MAKPRPNRLGMYADVQQILDDALRSSGGEYILPTRGEAVHWRQRAYRFRKLYAEVNGLTKPSPYDKLVLPRIPEGSNKVVIKLLQTSGTFIPASEPSTSLDLELETDSFADLLRKQIDEGEI